MALVPGRFGRSELLCHHPVAHESYGRAQGIAAARATVEGDTVITGRLAVNFATYEVFVGGSPVRLAATELRLVLALARRVGMAVEYGDLLRVLWDLTPGGESVVSCRHRLRVCTTRVREKLGPDAGLIVTIVGVGLRLDAVAPGSAPTSPDWNGLYGERPWSHAWLVCVRCGEARYPHGGHGYCSSCIDRAPQRHPNGRITP